MTARTAADKVERILKCRAEGMSWRETAAAVGMTSRGVQLVHAREKGRGSFSQAAAGSAGLPRSKAGS